MYKSLALLAKVRARGSAVFKDRSLKETCNTGSQEGSPTVHNANQ